MSTEAEIQIPVMTYGAWSQFLKRAVAPEFEPRARRQFHRYPYQASAKVFYEAGGKTFKRTWRLLEVSLNGAMAKTHENVPVDTQLRMQLELDTGWFAFNATVIHCTQTLGGFKVGLSIQFPGDAT